jgi:hypothetical protein
VASEGAHQGSVSDDFSLTSIWSSAKRQETPAGVQATLAFFVLSIGDPCRGPGDPCFFRAIDR